MDESLELSQSWSQLSIYGIPIDFQISKLIPFFRSSENRRQWLETKSKK